uniref:Nitrate reductase putative n=1 Tax=Albugo laibachii Nc14 TaxID=890382 RepID=F0X0K4_9STRA|nr:nitrate reductase putative [Albugo laibachii Nc14]|eukprot:CCA27295.1 nitrate reductase putative [Albugo laibachii Nc14]
MAKRDRKVTLAPGYSQLHWMRLTQSGRDLAQLGGKPPRKNITDAEVAAHNRENDAWMTLDGKVYNITSYLKYHPGGVRYLMMAAGSDGTALFNDHHAWINGHAMLAKCYIGDLEMALSLDHNDETIDNVALSTTTWRPFRLLSKQSVSKTAFKFVFELSGSQTLGVCIPGQHLELRVNIAGRCIERAYTPASRFSQRKSFELIIKLYPDGLMSSYLKSLPIGSEVEMRGPKGNVLYPSVGLVKREGKIQQRHVEHLVLVAAGSGITPMLQLIRATFETFKDHKTTIMLLYCNRAIQDIIALDQLETLTNMFSSRISVRHIISEDVEASFKNQTGSLAFRHGRLNDSMMLEFVGEFLGKETAFFHCGPQAFDNDVEEMLKSLNVSDSCIHRF